jgi:uncharacterized phiE125 gp8 family phage protein
VGLTLITAPAIEPLKLASAKLHLRQEETDDDDLIKILIVACREHAEMFTRRQFLTATWELSLDKFPAGIAEIKIPRPPLQSVSSIKYDDLDGNEQTLDSAVYDVDTGVEPGIVRLAYNQSWPSTRSQANAVRIRFLAGWTTIDLVPKSIRQALLLHISHLYDHPDAVVVEKGRATIQAPPLAYESLLWGNRVVRVY